jgi:hypothetical protein
MSDITHDQLGNYESSESSRGRKLQGEDVLAVSVAKLVGLAPKAPAFPRKVHLASLDPLVSANRKRPRHKALWISLVALLGATGVAMPRFAHEDPRSAPMMILRQLPAGLTVTSLRESPGGTPYIASSQFAYSGPMEDFITLNVSFDRNSTEKAFRKAGETPPGAPKNESSRFGRTILRMADGTEASLFSIPEKDPVFESLIWKTAGLEITLTRNEPNAGVPTLLTIANQLTPNDRSALKSNPQIPPGYKEINRVTQAGQFRRSPTGFQAELVNSQGDIYSIHSSPNESDLFQTPNTIEKIVDGKRVKVSSFGISWIEEGLSLTAMRYGLGIQSGEVRKPMEVDATFRELVAATTSGTVSAWKSQMTKRRTGFRREGTTTYRGLKLGYYVPTGKWTTHLMCLGPVTFASCYTMNVRSGFTSMALPDGRWMVVGMGSDLPTEVLTAARTERSGLGVPLTKDQDGVFDVITVGLDEVAIMIVGADKSYVEHDGTGPRRINRPRSY